MEFETVLSFVNHVMSSVHGRPLNDTELVLFKGAWQGQTYEAIAHQSGYSSSYLTRIAGPKFWQHLSDALGLKVSKSQSRAILEQLSQEWQNHPTQHEVPCAVDWGEAPDVAMFYGRQDELETLTQWLVGDRCRVVSVLGMGGIGKTALTAKWVETLVDEPHCPFTHIIWRSLRNAPSLTEMLGDLVLFLSSQQDTEATPKQLLHWLQQSRSLIVLDNMETILQEGDRAGCFRKGYEDYGQLLQLVADTRHQSRMILTSREKPAVVGTLEGVELGVRSLQMSGAVDTAHALLEAKGLQGTHEAKEKLAERYGYSPLALKIVATSIQSVFDGDIDLFLTEDTLVFNGIQRLLDQQFERLTALEQSIMYWLAINRDWTSITQLLTDLYPTVQKPQILEALESLSWRSLLETWSGRYSLQPVVMDYVCNHLLHGIEQELNTTQLDTFIRFALTKTTVPTHIYQSQVRLLLQPIAATLKATFPDGISLTQHLAALLIALRQSSMTCAGYGAGNLINLCLELHLVLDGYDFSAFTIRQANLQGATLHRVNFSHSTFVHTLFTRAFGNMLAVVYSNDGQWLAGGDDYGSVLVWRVADQQLSVKYKGHSSCILALAWHPSQPLLATASENGTAKIWDMKRGECLQSLEEQNGHIFSLAWHPNGEVIASGCSDSTIQISRVTGECLHRLTTHTATVQSVAWSADGRYLASGGTDGQLIIWLYPTMAPLPPPTPRPRIAGGLAWHPRMNALAYGSDNGITVWDVETNAPIQILRGHDEAPYALAWNQDGTEIVSGSRDRTIRLWTLATGQCTRVLLGHLDVIYDVGWCPAQSLIASCGIGPSLKWWNATTGDCISSWLGYAESILSLAWNPTAPLLASTTTNGRVILWDLMRRQPQVELKGHIDWSTTVGWSHDGRWLASGGHDATIKLWQVGDRNCIRTLKGDMDWVWTLAWHPHQYLLANGSIDPIVRIWDTQSGLCTQRLIGHDNTVRAVVWNSDGTQLATGSSDHTIRIWAMTNGECQHVLKGHTHMVLCLAWSPDDQYLISGSADRTVRLWDGVTGQCKAVLSGHREWVQAVEWLANGQQFVSAGMDEHLRLWDVSTLTCVTHLHAHTRKILALERSPDSSMLASGSADGTIKLWHPSLKLHHSLQLERPYEGVNISHVEGLTEAQQHSLKALGAIEVASSTHFASTRSDSTHSAASHPLAPPINSPQAEAPKLLSIQLLGEFQIMSDGVILELSSKRSQALLAYLVLNSTSAHSRQHLAFLFYPDISDSKGRTALRKDLFNLRQAIPDAERYINIDTQTIQWNVNTPYTLDVTVLETALAQAQQLPEEQVTAKQQQLERAIAYYRGDFLPTQDYEWVIQEREQLHQHYLDGLRQLIHVLEQQQDYAQAIHYGQQLLQQKPLQESTYQTLMRLHSARGDRAAALQMYHQCMTSLRDELGIDPSPVTQTLYQQLLE